MIEFRQEDLGGLLRSLDPEILRKAQRQTMNRVRSKVATRISRLARDRYSVPAATITRALARRIRFTNARDRSEAVLLYVGRRIGLINFGAQFRRVSTPRGARMGATTKLYKGKRRFLTKRGFIASGRSGNVHIYQRAERDQKQRLPLKALYGPSVPQMVGRQEAQDDLRAFVRDEYPKELVHQISYYMSRIK